MLFIGRVNEWRGLNPGARREPFRQLGNRDAVFSACSFIRLRHKHLNLSVKSSVAVLLKCYEILTNMYYYYSSKKAIWKDVKNLLSFSGTLQKEKLHILFINNYKNYMKKIKPYVVMIIVSRSIYVNLNATRY